MKRFISLLVCFMVAFVAMAQQALILNQRPTIKEQNGKIYISTPEKCFVINSSFPAHTTVGHVPTGQGYAVKYLTPGATEALAVTTDMVTEVPCTFTPDQDSEESSTDKPAGPGVLKVPSTENGGKLRPIYIFGFENGVCEIPQRAISALQVVAKILKENKDSVFVFYGGISLDKISVPCRTDQSGLAFHLCMDPKKDKSCPIKGDTDCQAALADCRSNQVKKWLLDNGVNPFQLKQADLQSVFDYDAPAELNRGVVGVIVSTRELAQKGGVIKIEVAPENCPSDQSCKPIIYILIAKEMVQGPAPQSTPARGKCLPRDKQEKMDKVAHGICAAFIIGGGAGGYAASESSVSSESSSGGVSSSVSISCSNDVACILGGIGIGLVACGITEVINYLIQKGYDGVCEKQK